MNSKLEKNNFDILIIDDSKYVIDFLTKFIELKGYSCTAVYDTSKAIDVINLYSPKLIFLDVNLADSNGYEFCKMLKSNNKFKNILVYFFTGEPESEVALKALEIKADGYLTKPFDLSDFDEIFEHLEQIRDK